MMPPRVVTLAPMPPEKCAYALARYSRSPDSIADSLEWVRTHDSAKFLESFYFQYGHASIADLGHLVLCFEGVSELGATEIEDEPLWDGQARSSRYQDFSQGGFVVPQELTGDAAERYRGAAQALVEAYRQVHEASIAELSERLPRPESMKPDAYRRAIAARAFDIARYLLFFGIPTHVGQVTSIRTLEKQVRRLKASEYAELRDLGEEIARACAARPTCLWDGNAEPVAPTLARYVDTDLHLRQSRADLKRWAEQNLPPARSVDPPDVDVMRPSDIPCDIVATLLYGVTALPYRSLYDLAAGWSEALRAEVIDVALQSRTRRDELLREFRGGPFVFDIVMDIGAYRDLHRHRRCHHFRQPFRGELGYEWPYGLPDAARDLYRRSMEHCLATVRDLPRPGADYLLPFGARSRFLIKMDFAEAEYLCRLRSGVKGHFSYRRIAWLMKEALCRLEPELGRLMQATPPWVEDPLQR